MPQSLTLDQIIDGIRPLDDTWIDRAKERTAQLALPPRALGRLHDIAERLCGIRETLAPPLAKRAFLVMAGDHGVTAEGVSAFPQAVTGEMIKNFLRGGAGINALAGLADAEVIVVDMGAATAVDPAMVTDADRFRMINIGPGTRNFATEPAMSHIDAERAVLAGFDEAARLFENGLDLLGTGDMGIGNTTPSAAMGVVFTGVLVDEMVGRGTGIDDTALARKRRVITDAIAKHQPNPKDGLDVLAKVGGFEIAGIAGAILAAAYYRRPVVVDGFISTAGALAAQAFCPKSTAYMFAGHCSEEPGHQHMLAHLRLRPILNLGLRLGEGTGAALAMTIIDGAARVMTEVLTFAEAGVSEAL